MKYKQYTNKYYAKQNYKFNPWSDCGNPKDDKKQTRRHIRRVNKKVSLKEITNESI